MFLFVFNFFFSVSSILNDKRTTLSVVVTFLVLEALHHYDMQKMNKFQGQQFNRFCIFRFSLWAKTKSMHNNIVFVVIFHFRSCEINVRRPEKKQHF